MKIVGDSNKVLWKAEGHSFFRLSASSEVCDTLGQKRTSDYGEKCAQQGYPVVVRRKTKTGEDTPRMGMKWLG